MHLRPFILISKYVCKRDLLGVDDDEGRAIGFRYLSLSSAAARDFCRLIESVAS